MRLILRIREYQPAPTVPLTPPCDVWLLTGDGITSALLHGQMFQPVADELAKALGKKVTVQREQRELPNVAEKTLFEGQG